MPSPGDLPNPGIELGSPALQADSLPAEPGSSGKPEVPLGDHLSSPYGSALFSEIIFVCLRNTHR